MHPLPMRSLQRVTNLTERDVRVLGQQFNQKTGETARWPSSREKAADLRELKFTLVIHNL